MDGSHSIPRSPRVLSTYDISENSRENLLVRSVTRYGGGRPAETVIEFRDMADGEDDPAKFALSLTDTDALLADLAGWRKQREVA
jgi:hypothetical protein